MTWLLGNWKLIVCGLALITAFGLGWYVKGDIDAVRASKLEITRQQAVIQQQQEVAGKERAASAITNTVESAYEVKIRDINDAYAGMLNGLQSSAKPANGNLPAISAAAGGAPAASAGNACRSGHRAAALAIAHQCDIQTQQLISLQEWVREQAQ